MKEKQKNKNIQRNNVKKNKWFRKILKILNKSYSIMVPLQPRK